MVSRPGIESVLIGSGETTIWVLYRDFHMNPLAPDKDRADIKDCFKVDVPSGAAGDVDRKFTLRSGGDGSVRSAVTMRAASSTRSMGASSKASSARTM